MKPPNSSPVASSLIDLTGLSVLITGGAGAIGRVMVRVLAEHGAQVRVVDIEPEDKIKAALDIAGVVDEGVDCHCNEKSGRLFDPTTPGVGTGGGGIAGGAAPQAVLERRQEGTTIPAQAAKQGQHGLQGLRHLVQRQAGLFFLSPSLPRSRKKCRSRQRVM